MCDFEKVEHVLHPTNEEKESYTVVAYISKTDAAKNEGEEGLLAATYGVSSSMVRLFQTINRSQ